MPKTLNHKKTSKKNRGRRTMKYNRKHRGGMINNPEEQPAPVPAPVIPLRRQPAVRRGRSYTIPQNTNKPPTKNTNKLRKIQQRPLPPIPTNNGPLPPIPTIPTISTNNNNNGPLPPIPTQKPTQKTILSTSLYNTFNSNSPPLVSVSPGNIYTPMMQPKPVESMYEEPGQFTESVSTYLDQNIKNLNAYLDSLDSRAGVLEAEITSLGYDLKAFPNNELYMGKLATAKENLEKVKKYIAMYEDELIELNELKSKLPKKKNNL